MATNRLSTFAPNRVTVVISQASTGISHVVSGFSTDSIVKIEASTEKFELYTGADNTSTRIYKGNEAGTISLSLQQTSPSNDIFSQLYLNDIASQDSSGLFTVTVKDNSGRSLYFASEAYIGKLPMSDFGNSMHHREWVVHCAHLHMYIGGNSVFSPEDMAALEALGGNIPTQWQP